MSLEDVIGDMIVEGKAGHIGGDMSVMEILTEIYFDPDEYQPWEYEWSRKEISSF